MRHLDPSLCALYDCHVVSLAQFLPFGFLSVSYSSLPSNLPCFSHRLCNKSAHPTTLIPVHRHPDASPASILTPPYNILETVTSAGSAHALPPLHKRDVLLCIPNSAPPTRLSLLPSVDTMDKEFYVSVELYVSAKAASALRKVCAHPWISATTRVMLTRDRPRP